MEIKMLPPLILAVVAAIVILIILWATGVFKKKVGYRLRQNFNMKKKIGDAGYVSNNYLPTDPSYNPTYWNSNFPQITQMVGVGGTAVLGMGYDLRKTNVAQPYSKWQGPKKQLVPNSFDLMTDNGECIWFDNTLVRNPVSKYSDDTTTTKDTMSNSFGGSGSAILDAINITASFNSVVDKQSVTFTNTSSYISSATSEVGHLLWSPDAPFGAGANQYCQTNNISSEIWRDLFRSFTVDGSDNGPPPDIWFGDNTGLGPLNNGSLTTNLETYVFDNYGTHIVTQIDMGVAYYLMSYSYLGVAKTEQDFELDLCIGLSPVSPAKPGGPSPCPPTSKCAGVTCSTAGQTCDPTSGVCGPPANPPTLRIIRGQREKYEDDPTNPPAACNAPGQDSAFNFNACDNYTQSDLNTARDTTIQHYQYVTGGSQTAQDQINAISDPADLPVETMVAFFDSASDPANTAAVGFQFTSVVEILQTAITNIFNRNPQAPVVTYPQDQTDSNITWALTIPLNWWTQAIRLLKLQYMMESICQPQKAMGETGNVVPLVWVDCVRDTQGNCLGSPASLAAGNQGDTIYRCNILSNQSGCTNAFGDEACNNYSPVGGDCYSDGGTIFQVNPTGIPTCDPGSGNILTVPSYSRQIKSYGGGCSAPIFQPCTCQSQAKNASPTSPNYIWDTTGAFDNACS